MKAYTQLQLDILEFWVTRQLIYDPTQDTEITKIYKRYCFDIQNTPAPLPIKRKTFVKLMKEHIVVAQKENKIQTHRIKGAPRVRGLTVSEGGFTFQVQLEQ